jgi:3',5'-cyclic-nucleotide phosphodiesterase
MLVDDDVLIDAGTGIGDLSLEDQKAIRHVFLTHAHLDHIAGLPMFIDCVWNTGARASPPRRSCAPIVPTR